MYANQLGEVQRLASRLVAHHEREPVPEFWLGYVHHLLGMVAYERNELDEAAAWFQRIASRRYIIISRAYLDALIGLALVANARGDMAGVDAHGADAWDWAVEIGSPASLTIGNSFALRRAMWAEAQPLTPNQGPMPNDHTSFWLEVPSVTWAERLLADDSAEVRAQALPFIESALARTERHHNLGQMTILSVLQAMALDADGRRDEALGVLDETLRRAAPRGLVRTFIDRGPQAKELLDALARQNGPDDHRDMLRGAFPGEPASRLQQIPTDVRPQAGLSFRELKVLELLTERLSNKEIAARIAVTPDAVKKRVNKIYRKLRVADRYEAVAVALARGIISKRS